MRASSFMLAFFAPMVALAAVSPDATCGGVKGYTCSGSKWGNCCSQYGWCGRTSAYCDAGKGCQAGFGTCSGLASSVKPSSSTGFRTSAIVASSPAAKPSSTQSVSTNARCGSSFGGKTCLGSKWGNCCSQYSYCGSTNDYCAAETCQKGFGLCDGILSSSSSIMSSSSRLSNTLTSLSASSLSSTALVSPPVSSSASSQTSSSSLSPASTSMSVASSSAFSSTFASSAASSTPPLPQPTCGASGNKRSSGPVTYYEAPPQGEQKNCKNYCAVFTNCYAYGYNQATFACVFARSTTTTAFDQAYTPAADGAYQWYLLACPTTVAASSSAAVSTSSSTGASSVVPSQSSAIISSSASSSAISSSTLSSSPIASSSTLSASVSSSATSATPLPQDLCGIKGTGQTISGVSLAIAPSTDLASCKNACKVYNAGGTTCRVYGYASNINRCFLFYGTIDFTLAQILTPNPASVVSLYDINCDLTTGPSVSSSAVMATSSPTPTSSPVPSSSPSATIASSSSSVAAPLPTCNVKGNSKLGAAEVESLSNMTVAQCKALCQSWTQGGGCRVYFVLPSINQCYITHGNPPPTFDQAVQRSESSSLVTYDISCA